MPKPADDAPQPYAPTFVAGERALVEVMVAEAYADDCCVRIVTGMNGFIQSVWVDVDRLKKIDGQVIARPGDPASIMLSCAREG